PCLLANGFPRKVIERNQPDEMTIEIDDWLSSAHVRPARDVTRTIDDSDDVWQMTASCTLRCERSSWSAASPIPPSHLEREHELRWACAPRCGAICQGSTRTCGWCGHAEWARR